MPRVVLGRRVYALSVGNRQEGAVTNEPNHEGHPLAEVLRNSNTTGTNQLTFAELLTLKQIITGAEPETVTFEIPATYEVLKDICTPHLYLDSGSHLIIPGFQSDGEADFASGEPLLARRTRSAPSPLWGEGWGEGGRTLSVMNS